MAEEHLYHLALSSDWEQAQSTGSYVGSTLGRSLEDEGFVHCSLHHQLRGVADGFYRGREDVILLEIDPAALTHEVRFEAPGPEPGLQKFPHVYGPIPTAAVLKAVPLAPDPDGRLTLPD